MPRPQTLFHPGHRPETTQSIDWWSSIWAGVIAGLVFAVIQMVLVSSVQRVSPLEPVRLMAAIVMGQEVLVPTSAGFDAGVLILGLIIHFLWSIALGVLIGWLVHRYEMGVAMMIGGAAGLAAYFLIFFVIAPSAFPWFATERDWMTALNYIVFGLVAAGAYLRLRQSRLSTAS